MRGRAGRRVAAALAVSVAAGALAGGAGAANVRTVGGPEFSPNEYIRDTLRFAPGHIVVRRNARVTWIDRDEAPEPHTITIVNRRNMPGSVEELFECEICSLANAHLEDPENPESDIARMRVNRGAPGLNQEGDSLVLAPGGRIAARVTAAVGRTISYLCAIHPWMQGTITVSRTGAAAGPGLTGRGHH
jgi:hypothetical protein